MKIDRKTNQLISLMLNTARLIRQTLKEKRPSIISILQLEVLSYVKEEKKPLMKDVAEFLHITPPSATSLINRLVEGGLLKREIDKNDRRIIRLTITSKGEKILKKKLAQHFKRLSEIIEKLNKKEQEFLIQIFLKLQRIYKNKEKKKI